MRYMLTGDHWNAEEAYRIGEVQQVAPTPEKALEAGIQIANKIAAWSARHQDDTDICASCS